MDKIYLGNKLEGFESSEPFAPITRIILKVDGETEYVSGDESGRTIEKACAWGSQKMADSILNSLRGVEYTPFEGRNALLDPAAEIGDAITVAGQYGILAGMSRNLDRLFEADVFAPGADELEDEFQYKPREERELDRIQKRAYSRISKTADQILLEVSNELEGLSASVNVELDSISAQVVGTQNAISILELEVDGITQRVQDAEGNLAEMELTASGLVTRVEDVEDGFAELEFTLDGLTITDADGTTRINGSAIYTNNLYVKAANITGILTAHELQGDTIYLYDDDGNYAASLTVNTASTADYKLDIKAEAIAITTEEPGAYVFLGNADGAYFQLAGTRAYFGAHVRPDSDGGYDLGGSSYRWKNIYATNDIIQTSDKKKKKNISYTLDKFDIFFDGLKPGTYQMIDGKRDHTGLVAQDVEANLEKCGITPEEFAGFVKAEREDGNGYDYGLRYGEFVALLIDQVQKLKARMNTWEDKHGSKKSA